MGKTTIKKEIKVIESGTETISEVTWTYRKYSDGTAECWGMWEESLTSYAQVFGGYAFCSSLKSFPTNLFNSYPIVTYSAYCAGSLALTGTIAGVHSKVKHEYFLVSNGRGPASCEFFVHAIGRWK